VPTKCTPVTAKTLAKSPTPTQKHKKMQAALN
jgi:hypothetical protein